MSLTRTVHSVASRDEKVGGGPRTLVIRRHTGPKMRYPILAGGSELQGLYHLRTVISKSGWGTLDCKWQTSSDRVQ